MSTSYRKTITKVVLENNIILRDVLFKEIEQLIFGVKVEREQFDTIINEMITEGELTEIVAKSPLLISKGFVDGLSIIFPADIDFMISDNALSLERFTASLDEISAETKKFIDETSDRFSRAFKEFIK